jgi:adenylate cyclase
VLLRIFEFFKMKGGKAFFLWGAASAVISILFYRAGPGFLNDFDLKARDAMMKFRGNAVPPPEVIIVAVDEKSINELGRWPWPRKYIAELVKGLKPAKVVALDMLFSEPEDEENDVALKEAVADAGNVVLGYFFRNDSTGAPREKSIKQLERSKIGLIRFLDAPRNEILAGLPVIEFKGVETNISSIGQGAAGFGSFNIVPDDDGLYRVANLVYKYGENLYPALPVEALRMYTGQDPVLTLASYGFDGIAVSERAAPLNEEGALSLNFYGPGGTFATYPAVDIIKGRVREGVFKDKLVFVGATEKAIYDIRGTPLDPVYPGVEIHATVAGNVLQQRFLILDGTVVFLNILLVIALPLILAALISKVRRTYHSLSLFSLLLLALVAGIYHLFATYNLVVSVIFPVFSLSLAYLLLEAYRNVVVEKKSRYLRKAFSTYVSSQVVSEILKDPDLLKLGGEKKVVSILFADVRGFTTLSERMPPEELVSLLNEYLSPMTRIVLAEEGTLDKYIGDSIMAIFNAPIEIPNHPKRACSVALRMMAELPRLNDTWSKRGLPALFIGIGIHTGEAVVGNMGTDLRFDYTAIGDTVNLAARLEGMNKVYGTNIIVSEATFKEVADDFIFRKLDFVKVKGKEKPVGIYEMVDFHSLGAPGAELSRSFNRALAYYRKGDFKTAMAEFERLGEKFPGDGPSMLYRLRCREYMDSPPPSDWDGIYVAKTK